VLPTPIVEAAYRVSGLAAWPGCKIRYNGVEISPVAVFHGGDAGGASWDVHAGSVAQVPAKMGNGSVAVGCPWGAGGDGSDGAARSNGGGYYQSANFGTLISTGDKIIVYITRPDGNYDVSFDSRDAAATRGLYHYAQAAYRTQLGCLGSGAASYQIVDAVLNRYSWNVHALLLDVDKTDGWWGTVNGQLEVAKGNATLHGDASSPNGRVTLLAGTAGTGAYDRPYSALYLVAVYEATDFLNTDDTAGTYDMVNEIVHGIAGLCAQTVPAGCPKGPKIARTTVKATTASDGHHAIQRRLSLLTGIDGEVGWLIAPARTHQITYSTAALGWSSFGCTAVFAGGLIADTNNRAHHANENAGISLTAGNQYCAYSVINPTLTEACDWVRIYVTNNADVYFDIRNVAAGVTKAIGQERDLGCYADANGFVHCWVTFIAAATSGETFYIGGAASDGNSVFVAAGNRQLHWLDNGICEETYCGHYQTGASTVTLDTEVVTLDDQELTFANGVNPADPFSFGISLRLLGRPAGDRCVWSINNGGGSANRAELYITTEGYAKLVVEATAGDNGEVVSSVNLNDGEWHDIVCSVDTNNLRLWIDEVLIGTDTSCAMPVISQQTLGSRYDGTLGAGVFVRDRWLADKAVA
jgi:hypothetical protein